MRRLAFVLALLGAPVLAQQPNGPRPTAPPVVTPVQPPPVVAPTAPIVPPPVAPGLAWRFDAADYGYPPAAGSDPAVPVQKTFDAAAAYVAAYQAKYPGFPPRAVVHVPAGAPNYTYSPIYKDSSYVEFEGDGRNSRLMTAPTLGHPVFVVGIPRVSASGFTPGPAVRPDLFGVLDSTAAPAPGKRWGLAIGPTFLWQHGGVLDRGGPSPTRGPPTCDGFAETNQLTIEWAIGPAAGATTLPAGTWAGVQGCYALNGMDARGGYAFVFTSVGPDGIPVQSLSRFTAPNAAGVKRVTVQADLTPATGPVIAAWVDGVQVAVSATGLVGPRTFARNEFSAFTAGCAITGPSPQPPFGVATIAPHNLYGFCLSKSLRYKLGAVGSAQARADSAAITDAYRYFPTRNVALGQPAITDADFLGFLALTESPALAQRHMQVAAGSDFFSVAFVGDKGMFPGGAGLPTQVGNGFKNLSVVGGRYGSGIEVSGGVLGLTMEGVEAEGGAYGVGTIPHGANYGHIYKGCTFGAWEACWQGFYSSARMRDVTFTNNGRVALLSRASDLQVDGGFVAATGFSDHFARFCSGGYGGSFSLKNVQIDNENNAYLKSGVYCERHPYGTTQLGIDNLYFSQVGKGIPLIQLRDMAGPPNNGTWTTGVLDATMIRVDGAVGATVEADGPGFVGGVRNSVLPGGVTSLATFGATALTVADPTKATATTTPAPGP